MLDIDAIRSDPQRVKEAIRAKVRKVSPFVDLDAETPTS